MSVGRAGARGRMDESRPNGISRAGCFITFGGAGRKRSGHRLTTLCSGVRENRCGGRQAQAVHAGGPVRPKGTQETEPLWRQ